MTREEIINGLKFTVEMFLLDPNTGETVTEPRNDMDKTTIDACRGAIELLEQEPCDDCVSRQTVMALLNKRYCRKEPYEHKEGNTIYKGYDTYYMINFDKLKALLSVLPKRENNDVMNRILKRMWNCRGKHTTSIDKVKMEQIIRDELPFVNPKADVLDKIRTEIEQRSYGIANDSVIQGMTYERANILEIIDKHIAESED